MIYFFHNKVDDHTTDSFNKQTSVIGGKFVSNQFFRVFSQLNKFHSRTNGENEFLLFPDLKIRIIYCSELTIKSIFDCIWNDKRQPYVWQKWLTKEERVYFEDGFCEYARKGQDDSYYFCMCPRKSNVTYFIYVRWIKLFSCNQHEKILLCTHFRIGPKLFHHIYSLLMVLSISCLISSCQK